MKKIKLTLKDLFRKKGKEKLTELYVTNALEAYASEQAGIDILIATFNKETLRTGEVTNKWLNAYNLLGVDPYKLSNYSGRA